MILTDHMNLNLKSLGLPTKNSQAHGCPVQKSILGSSLQMDGHTIVLLDTEIKHILAGRPGPA